MRRNEINYSLDSIPLEILLLIVTRLNPICLIYLRINQYFRSIISLNLNTLWQNHFFIQFGISIDPSKKRKKSLPTLFANYYRFSNCHLNAEEKECFTLVSANDLYLIKNRNIEFSLSLLEKHDSQLRTLLTVIRMQNNHFLNKYIFDNIFQKSSNLSQEVMLITMIETAIKLDQDNVLLRSYLHEKDLNKIMIHKETILSFAVRNNALCVLKLLLKCGADPNHAEAQTCPPLHIAARMGFLEIVDELLAHQAIKIDALYKNKYTPLYMAAGKGHIEVVHALLKKGANKNGMPGYYPLFNAMEEKQTAVVRFFLEHHADIDIEANGFSLVYVASRNNHLDGLKALVNHCKENEINLDFEAIAHDNSTALYVAAQNGFADICQFLIDHGATPDCKFHQSTPLFIAAAYGDFEVIKVLCAAKKPTLYLSPKELFFIVAIACENNYHDIATYLLHLPDLNLNFLMQYEFLHLACQYEYLSLVKLLVTMGVNVDSKNKQNKTPLQIAVLIGHKEIINFLLDVGANPNVPFPNGNSIIKVVCANVNRSNHCLSIIRSLINARADLSSLTPHMKIFNHRVSAILRPPLERLALLEMDQVANVRKPYDGDKFSMIAVLTEFISHEENWHCKDARLCLNLLKNISTPFGCAVILYALLAKNNDHLPYTFSFNAKYKTPFTQCVINTFNFQSAFTAQHSFYVMIFASLGYNRTLLNVLKELVIEPIKLDTVTMCNDTYHSVMFCLNLFEDKIKHAPLLQMEIDEKKSDSDCHPEERHLRRGIS